MPARICSNGQFIKAYLKAYTNGGSMQDVADNVGLKIETCWTKKKRINAELEAAGVDPLPNFRRKKTKLNPQAVQRAIDQAKREVRAEPGFEG